MSGKRIVFLDVLRGMALLGILYAHLVIWYTGSALPDSVYHRHSETSSMVAMAIFGTFVLGKFFSVFSFLFGAGLGYRDNNMQGIITTRTYDIRRFLALIVIGFIHHLFWRGDILMIYGVLGFGLLMVTRFPPRVLLLGAAFFMLDVPGLFVRLVVETDSLPMQEASDHHLWLMEYGTFRDHLKANLLILDNKVTFQLESGRLSRTFGFFMLGFYAARQHWFTSEQGTWLMARLYRVLLRVLLIMVVSAAILFLSGVVGFDREAMKFHSPLPLNEIYQLYNVVFSVFIIVLTHRLYTKSSARLYLEIMSYPGRMAMTVYLTQTAIGLVLFYPFGIHLFDKTNPAINALLVFPVFLLQIGACRWWLMRFKQGPLEWVTRVIARGEETVPRIPSYTEAAPEIVRNK